MKDNSSKTNIKSLESLYLSQDFKGAKEYLLKHRTDYPVGQYHYNLGTLNIKTKDYPVARFHLEKALSSGYVNTKSFNNLKLVKEVLQVSDVDQSDSLYDQALSYGKGMPSSGFLFMSLLLVLAIAIGVRFKLVMRRWVVALLFIVALLPALISQLYLSRVDMAVALQDSSLREGPSKIYAENSVVRAGTKFIIGESSGDWVFIVAPANLAGWVNRSTLGIY